VGSRRLHQRHLWKRLHWWLSKMLYNGDRIFHEPLAWCVCLISVSIVNHVSSFLFFG
jgi:hypothetical protein